MRTGLEYIQNLDLHYLICRLVQKYNWEEADAQEAIRKYKNFLILKCHHSEITLVPSPEIDEVWHNHILFTQNYIRDCEHIFGYYFHHSPSMGTPVEIKLLNRLYIQTMHLYLELFKEPYRHDLELEYWFQEDP